MKTTWVRDVDESIVVNPQTSALAVWRGELVSIADGSAEKSHQLRLLSISPQQSRFSRKGVAITQSQAVSNGCFADYLSYGPDLEALVVDPDDDNVFITVTEDAYHFRLSGECERLYGNTGSTAYPTLLLRVELQADATALITHVKALQFHPDLKVGDFPNDGIEGMAFGDGRRLYLGLEKDSEGQPRIFHLDLQPDFWATPGMAAVIDSGLDIPRFDSGAHPINALAYYPGNQGFLLAAARNDDQIWIIDTQKQKPTLKIDAEFLAESLHPQCPDWHTLESYSMEGLAVMDDRLWILNDPWVARYHENIACAEMETYYKQLSPLIGSVPIPSEWMSR